MLKIKPNTTNTKDLHQYLLSSIGPRPIALASTIDTTGNKNVSPFSFFNVFSANPPILIFSPARRVRDNTTKDTLQNLQEIPEVVINIVNNALAEQASLSSNEYPKNVDEFIKAGLTPVNSEEIKPFRVKESPVQMECKVNQIINLGENGGAGNLIICEILLIHIHKNVLDNNMKIDQDKLQLVGRLGSNWYCKAFNHSLFEIKKPSKMVGVGFEEIPQSVKNSSIFSKNDLTQLASISHLPEKQEIQEFLSKKNRYHNKISEDIKKELYAKAHQLIKKGDIKNAWKYILFEKLNEKK